MNRLKKIFPSLFSLCIIGYSLFSIYKIARSFAGDFSVYYHAGVNLYHGVSLYTHISYTLFAYPPLSAFLYVPLLFLSYATAQSIFVILSYICVFLCISVSLHLLNKRVSWQVYLFVCALTLLAFPTKFTLGMGQSNLIALFLLLLAILFQRQNRYFYSGLLLALSIVFKPIFILLVLYFVVQKQWKVILWCISIGVAFSVLELVFFPKVIISWEEYFTWVLPHLITPVGREVYYNQGIMGFVSRLSTSLSVRSVVSGILSLGTVVSGVWLVIKKNDKNFSLAIFCTILPLIDSLSWQHHFVILLFPFIYLALQLRKTLINSLLLTIAYVLIATNIKHPEHFTHFPLTFLLSHVFYGTVLLFILLFLLFWERRELMN